MTEPRKGVAFLAIARQWKLYAFPADSVCEDRRGIEIGDTEIAQLIEAAVSGLADELGAMTRERDLAIEELRVLREQTEKANRDAVHARMTGK